MNIPFIDLKTQYTHIQEAVGARIQAVLAHGQYIMGPEIDELETELARFAGVKHAISCSSGTDALLLPLMAIGIGPGDAVFTTPFTFFATAEVISLLGATPVFVDIHPRTFNIDPEKLRDTVKRVKREGKLKAKAVIPVDLFGLPADYDAIEAIGQEEDLFILEDTAQGLGGVYKGRPAGSFGQAAATSFFPAKPLGAYGDAGATFTDDDALAEIMRSLRIHGQGIDKYNNTRIGLNARMDTIQAAILLCKLAIFPQELKARQKAADLYEVALSGLETPFVPKGYKSSWAQYSVLSDHRELLQEALGKAGIPTAVYYVKSLHLQSVYAGFGYKEGDFPVSEHASQRIFSLPMHPYLDEAIIAKIGACVTETLNTL